MSQEDRTRSNFQDTAVLPDTAMPQAATQPVDPTVAPPPAFATPPIPAWGETFGPGVVTETGGFSVQSYADRLMDDLFDNMEDSLERGGSLSNEMVQPEPVVMPPKQLQQMVLTSLMQRRQTEMERVDADQTGISDLVAAAAPAPLATAPETKASKVSLFDRLLLGVGCMAIAATATLWFVQHRPNLTPPAVSVAPVANPFGDYMKQALQTIAAKTPFQDGTANKPAASTPSTGMPAITVPTTTGPTALMPAPTRMPTGLTRLVPPAPLPNLGAQTAAPSAPSAPGFMASSTALPPGGTLTPGVVRSLVGVMQLGDRSAALVEINGVAQRVRVGESIGSSGWTLVEVSKDQAVMRRNGEVRSIFIGQTF